MDTKILNKIGLTQSEQKVYLALLDLGDSTRGDIVNESGIAGSKVYEVLDKLQEKGLVSIYVKSKVKHFKVTNPNQILNYLDEKKKEVLDLEVETKLILPQLMAKFSESKEDKEVELITGIKGLQVIFREQVELLKKGEVCYVIGGTNSSEEEKENAIQAFFEKIHLMREEKGIKTRMLFNVLQKESTEKLYSSKKYPGTTTKYISHSAPVAINVYLEHTVIIIFGKDITAIHIKSKDVSKSFLEYFELLWKQS